MGEVEPHRQEERPLPLLLRVPFFFDITESVLLRRRPPPRVRFAGEVPILLAALANLSLPSWLHAKYASTFARHASGCACWVLPCSIALHPGQFSG